MRIELKIIILLGIICILLSVSCVNAAEKTNSVDVAAHNNIDKIPVGNDISVHGTSDKITAGNDVSAIGTLDELNNNLSSLSTGGHFRATKDYVLNNTKEQLSHVIKIDANNVTIDGNGHTIDAGGLSKHFGLFKITGNNVKLSNFKFINSQPELSKLKVQIPIINKKFSIYNLKSPIDWQGNNGLVSNCEFVGNQAMNGGAISWSGSNGLIENSRFIDNTALGVGGAIFMANENNTIKDCQFINSTSKLSGEEIYLNTNRKNIRISNCKFDSASKIHVIDGSVTGIDGKFVSYGRDSYMANETIDLVPMIYKSIVVGGVNNLDNGISYSANFDKNKKQFILSTSRNIDNHGITFMKDYHFKNIENYGDVFKILLAGKDESEYQLIVNKTVESAKDYEDITTRYKFNDYVEPVKNILKPDIKSINETKITKALNIKFLKRLEFKTTQSFGPGDRGFDIINIDGHNSRINGEFDSSSEVSWSVLKENGILIASNLEIAGFNNAVINLGGNCIFNNVAFYKNQMDYWFKRDWGAGILNTGEVVCNNCTFMHNHAKNGGAIFNQGKLYINNCQFYKNEAYGVGNDICVGDGGTVIYNKMIVTPECHPKEVCFAQSLTATKSKLITGLCMGGSFLVGLGVGIFTANPALGLLAGAGAGALLGSLGAGVIIAKNYDINFSRTKTCLILIGGSVGAGALGGVIGGCVGLALKPAPATPEQIIEYMYGKETAVQDFLYA